ncbi:MAG TPA: rhamnogalacturonan acetylesterase [Terracidiphilus sp.]|nr:rhamnogalacturonan acetylesterase [Terracidiphilus sp.]
MTTLMRAMRDKNICIAFVAAILAFTSARGIAQIPAAGAAPPETSAVPAQHPALFLVGDSIMNTGTGTGEVGPWGWGAEIIPMFDSTKIHVYNDGRGGRSSRGYIEEGAWAEVLEQLQPGDFVIIQFGHNDSANSKNYPDRTTLQGNGDETQEIDSPVTHAKETIHTYGWYLRQYVKAAKSKGATAILCSPTPRNSWEDGKIRRGFDGYAQWAKKAATMSGALFIDLNTISADHFDTLGQEKAATYFNDFQHTRKIGAQLNAASVVEGIKQLKDCPLASYLVSATP